MTQQEELLNKIKQVELQWNSLTDELRWMALPDMQKEIPALVLNLDNDSTFLSLKSDIQEVKDFILEFDDYIGWNTGIQPLLKAFNIKAELV